MKDFHHLPRLTHEDIDVSIRRIKSDHPDQTTAHTHIRRMMRHDNAVIFIQIEHSVFASELCSKNAMSKLADFGRIRKIYSPKLPAGTKKHFKFSI